MEILQAYKSFIYAFSHLHTWKLHIINADNALYRIKIYRNCIKIHKMTKYKKRQKRVKNLTSEWNQL